MYRLSHKDSIDKKLLVGAAHGFNSQFLEIICIQQTVRFVWRII